VIPSDIFKMIVIDSGNTRCKIWVDDIAIFKNYEEQFSVEELTLLKKRIQSEIAISSVAPIKFSNIKKQLQEIGFKKFIDVGEWVKKENLLGNKVEGIGADRILGMIGAATYLKPPLITVDCGTAVTVNFLKSEDECEGGAIFAGFNTQVRALTGHTEGIIFKKGNSLAKSIGRTTSEALESGILHSITGGIIVLYNSFLKESGVEKAELVITGGDAERVFKKLSEEKIDCTFKNDLIKLGIEKVFRTLTDEQKEKYTLK
jgi:type III pantothenate kinase